MGEDKAQKQYRGRIAPTPSGYLHEGNVKTFRVAMQRANNAKGKLFLRMDDLDSARCKGKYFDACIEDLDKAGLVWDEYSELPNDVGVCRQSYRTKFYHETFQELMKTGLIYACNRTRREIRKAGIKNRFGEEYLFPEKWRGNLVAQEGDQLSIHQNWRVATNWGEQISLMDRRLGKVDFEIGKDFSDFLIWRKDGFPAYELASVVDDRIMRITEIVRGEDLLLSSAKQCLLYDILAWRRPDFYHCKLILDGDGKKLSKSSRSATRFMSKI